MCARLYHCVPLVNINAKYYIKIFVILAIIIIIIVVVIIEIVVIAAIFDNNNMQHTCTSDRINHIVAML